MLLFLSYASCYYNHILSIVLNRPDNYYGLNTSLYYTISYISYQYSLHPYTTHSTTLSVTSHTSTVCIHILLTLLHYQLHLIPIQSASHTLLTLLHYQLHLIPIQSASIYYSLYYTISYISYHYSLHPYTTHSTTLSVTSHTNTVCIHTLYTLLHYQLHLIQIQSPSLHFALYKTITSFTNSVCFKTHCTTL